MQANDNHFPIFFYVKTLKSVMSSSPRSSKTINKKENEVNESSWVLPQFAHEFVDDMAKHDSFYVNKNNIQSLSLSSSRHLMGQQVFVREFLNYDTPYRGLLLYHGLGSGKTCAAIASAVAITDNRTDIRVFVMLPASLRKNFENEVPECGGRRLIEQGLINYVHYNGLNSVSIANLVKGGFDDSVIIIDEVHNFISSVSNEGQLTRLYNAIMNASGSKIILLSGTPLVNSPHELGLIINLINGYVTTVVKPLDQPIGDVERSALVNCPTILSFAETTMMDKGILRPALHLILTPNGFIKDDTNKRVRYDKHTSRQQSQLARSCLASVFPRDVRSGRNPIRTVKSMIIPNAKEDFDSLFVDIDTLRLKNTNDLERILVGKVSYFEGHAAELYPTLRKIMIVRSYLSAHQFAEYSYQRAIEIRREKYARARANKDRGRDEIDSGMGYRPYTRAICNFAFPHDLPRPYKNFNNDTSAGATEYEKQLENRILELKSNFPYRLRLCGKHINQNDNYTLESLSTKFAAILRHLIGHEDHKLSKSKISTSRNINETDPMFPVLPESVSTGKKKTNSPNTITNAGDQQLHSQLTIIYSQFRNAEGVALFSSILDVNGFSRLECYNDVGNSKLRLRDVSFTSTPSQQRYIVFSNENPEHMDILLSIFNNRFDELPDSIVQDLLKMTPNNIKRPNDLTNMRGELIRIMLITKSGAEGISTRNVRQVHIMEPFWHANRIEQVIGRARRAHSHDDLPIDERFIDVFIHMSTFSREQARIFAQEDDGRTTDEYVHNISQRKRVLLKEVYSMMRRTAVDCKSGCVRF